MNWVRLCVALLITGAGVLVGAPGATADDCPDVELVFARGTGEPPDAALERGETARAVRASLGTLPEPQRRAVMLAFFGGLSHGDVAAVLGIPLGTAKTRIRAGLHRLRDALRPYAPEAGR